MTEWTDGDPEEEALLKELESPFGALRSSGRQCPDPALLTAAPAGVLPAEVTAAVEDHLLRCPVCRRLARDLADPELTAPTGLEAARIRATVVEGEGTWRPASAGRRAPGVSGRAGWFRWWRPVSVAATVVAALALGWWALAERTSAPEVAVIQPIPSPEQPPQLVLEKPPVTMPLAAVLVWRGEPRGTQDRYLEELGNALRPYRSDDFAEAARRLDALARNYPTAEVRFYRGVCRLFLNRHDLAIADFVQARQVAEPALAQEAAWYLAVAYERAGQRPAAVAELRVLCGGQGERQAKACEALTGLEPDRR